jgi:hypothetical protein
MRLKQLILRRLSPAVHQKMSMKHKSETRVRNTHTLTVDTTTTSRNRPVPELTPVHKAYKLALSQEPVTPMEIDPPVTTYIRRASTEADK